jgi:hypothetical protein
MESSDIHHFNVIKQAELCAMCRGISVTSLVRMNGYRHYESASKLKESASNCWLCQVIQHGLEDFECWPLDYGHISLEEIPGTHSAPHSHLVLKFSDMRRKKKIEGDYDYFIGIGHLYMKTGKSSCRCDTNLATIQF